MRTPIAIFCYNRVDVLSRLIDNLSKCNHVDEHDVYIFSDGWNYKKADDQKNVELVRKYIETIEKKDIFKKVETIYSYQNKGCRESIIKGLTYVLRQYGRVIHLEDDLIVSEDFLDYMDDALDFFENDNRIFSISGFTFPLKAVDSLDSTTYLGRRGCSCGFGTWIDRWEMIDWEVSDYDLYRMDENQQRSFANVAYDLPYMIKYQKERHLDSWAIVQSYYEWKFGKYTVYPQRSKVFHLGKNGTHVGNEEVFQQEINLDSKPYSFSGIAEHDDINEEARGFFLSKDDFERNPRGEWNNYQEYCKLLVRWMKLRSRGINIVGYFKNRKIQNIAIYGAGMLADVALDEFEDSEVHVNYLIDREKKSDIRGKKVYSLDEQFPDVEMIVITPITEAYEICKKLKEKTNAELVSLEALI